MPNLKKDSKALFEKARNKLLRTGTSTGIFKNMSILATGSVVAKVIGIATYPVITRIYSPSDFGVLSVFTSAIAILVPFATFRYSVVIPLPKTDVMAMNIFVVGSLMIFALSLVLSGVFWFVGEPIFEFLNMVEINKYWWLLILGVIGAGFYELLSKWATRKKSFGPVAKTTVWQALVSSVAKIGLGVVGFKPVGLLIGVVAQKGGGVFSLIKYFYHDFKHNIKEVTRRRVIFLIKYYKDLPLYRLPSQFILQVSTTMPVLYFAYQFGSESTGHLGLAKSMISIPVSLLAGNVSKVYYAEISELGKKNSEKIILLTKSIIIKLTTISIAPILILIFFAPELFKFAFGEEWEVAGRYTSILSLYTILVFITMPLMSIFNVYNKQRKYLEINLVRLFLLIIIFGLSHLLLFDEIQTLYLFVTIYSLHFVFAGYQAYSLLLYVNK